VEPAPVSGSKNHPGSLTDLVARTAGLQPGRRIFHAVCGTLIALSLHLLPIERPPALGILGGLGLLLLAGDLIRLRVPVLNRIFFTVFRSLASPREAEKVASSTWFMAGCFAAVALFPREIAVASILVLALADAAASYFGRLWGRRPWGSGSVEGSAIFFLVALATLLLMVPPLPAVAAAMVATWAERIPWKVDDNLSVPLVTGAVLWAAVVIPG